MPVGETATKGVLGEARPAGHRERRGMADGGARVPEVLSAAFIHCSVTGDDTTSFTQGSSLHADP